MLQDLADESEKQSQKMNKLKSMVMIENNRSLYVNNTQKMLKATSVWDSDTASETKTKQMLELGRRWKWTWARYISRIRDN